MTLRLTLNVFSGRPNPTVVVDGIEADELLARLAPLSRRSVQVERGVDEGFLGYRGISVEQVGERVSRLPRAFRIIDGGLVGPRVNRATVDENVEDFICGSTGPFRRLQQPDDFFERLEALLRHRRHWKVPPKRRPHGPKRPSCECAPLYEPEWWNDAGTIQYNNNCYNYSTNYRTDTFAQPGHAAGQQYSALTCASVRPAAIADCLIYQPAANNKCPKEGHLVALVIAPGWDFHWYRKGRNGYWSHKPGGTAATNVDNSGSLIPDPRNADRGPYTNFCTFMVVMDGHIKIS